MLAVAVLRDFLYRLQLRGYNKKYCFEYIPIIFSRVWVSVVITILLLLSCCIFDIVNTLSCCVISFLNSIFLFVQYFPFWKKSKVVLTKRLFRIIFISLLLLFAMISLSYLYLEWLFVLVVLFHMFVLPIIVFCSLVILIPCEKIVALYYLNSAKKILKQKYNLIKVAITGSYGKTTVKEILDKVLSVQFSVLSTPKSYNTPFGIMKTINNDLNNLHEIFVCEMGAKKNGEINELCELVNPDIGIVTSVGRQHLETFHSLNNIYLTKKELPDNLVGKSCVFNLNNYLVGKMFDCYNGNKIGVYLCKKHNLFGDKSFLKCNKKYFISKGLDCSLLFFYPKKSTICARNIKLYDNGSSFDVVEWGCCIGNVFLPLVGIHNISNALLAIAVAILLGEGWNNILLGIGRIEKIPARLERIVLPSGAVILNNGYNSNIDSAKSTLAVLDLFKNKRKIVITPGLVETGDDEYYNTLFGELVSGFCNEVIIVKDKNFTYISQGLKNKGFDMAKVINVDNFDGCRELIRRLDSNCVALIENDLPDNYF